jgi:superfamily I DNA/RNA helicase
MDNISKQKARVLKYPTSVYKKHGRDALDNDPLITIGTIHSVKGAEADVVVLFPDISYQAYAEVGTIAGRDAAHRLFYVGMTRAKHALILCEPTVMRTGSEMGMYINL